MLPALDPLHFYRSTHGSCGKTSQFESQTDPTRASKHAKSPRLLPGPTRLALPARPTRTTRPTLAAWPTRLVGLVGSLGLLALLVQFVPGQFVHLDWLDTSWTT